MTHKYTIGTTLCFILLFFLSACSEENTLPVYVENIVDETSLQIDKEIIVSGDEPLLIRSTERVFESSDQLLLRSKETQIEIVLTWGYEYIGLDDNGNRTYDFNEVVAKIDFDDKWNSGAWEIVLQRDNERQLIGEVKFLILLLKEEDGNPEAFVDKSELYKRNIYLYAKGWQNADMDTIEIVDQVTNEIVLKKGSPASSQTEDYSKVLLNFNAEDLETGNYEVNIRRWQYSFRQYLFDFEYFKIALLNNEPITADADGNYFIDFYLDEIVENDKVRVSYGGGKTQFFEEVLSEENFTEETNIYRIYIPEKKLYFGNTYTVSLTRKGTAMTIGAKVLPEKE